MSANKVVCFISASANTNLRTITKILSHRHVRVVTISSVISSSMALHDSVAKAISKADFVIAVLNDSEGNILYEIGYASALRKEIIIVAPKTYNLPMEIEGRFVLRTDINNDKALEFVLDQVLSRIYTTAKEKLSRDYNEWPKSEITIGPHLQDQMSISKPRKSLAKYRPLGGRVDKYIDRLIRLGEKFRQHDLENIVCDILKESGVSILVRSHDNEQSADIAVWVDRLNTLSNPVLIEIKTHITNDQQAEAIARQMSKYMELNRSRFALVVFAKGTKKHYMHPWMESFIYFLDIYEFIELIRIHSFKKILTNIVKERYSEESY